LPTNNQIFICIIKKRAGITFPIPVIKMLYEIVKYLMLSKITSRHRNTKKLIEKKFSHFCSGFWAGIPEGVEYRDFFSSPGVNDIRNIIQTQIAS